MPGPALAFAAAEFRILLRKMRRKKILTPNQKLLKLTLEDSLKENSKGRESSTDLGRQLVKKLLLIYYYHLTFSLPNWLDSTP